MLVNNASKQYMYQDFQDTDLDKTEDIFKSNIIQMIAMAKFALPHMTQGDSYVVSSPELENCKTDGRLASSIPLPS